MTSIGIICSPLTSHIIATAAIARELQKRGHQVTFFQIPDAAAGVEAEGLGFWVLGEADYPLGSMAQFHAKIGQLSGLSAMRYAFHTLQQTNAMLCRDAPEALKKAGVELLLIDQNEPIGGTIADFLGLPFVSICCSLPFNREHNVPPHFTPWNYRTVWWAFLRNQLGYSLFDLLTRSITQGIAEQRQAWRLPAYTTMPNDAFSGLAQISQLTPDFDFPRQNLPDYFHYTGLFRRDVVPEVAFPYECLGPEPLVYTSLGTVLCDKPEIFHRIAVACAGLGVQLVVSLGGRKQMEAYRDLPGKTLVFEYVPQMELLKRARLTITHGGSTTLESLSCGVPMVAIPIAADQHGMSARIRRAGVGEVVPPSQLRSSRLRAAVSRVLTDDSYRQRAERMKASLQQAGGAVRAANIVEQVILTGQPVLASHQRKAESRGQKAEGKNLFSRLP